MRAHSGYTCSLGPCQPDSRVALRADVSWAAFVRCICSHTLHFVIAAQLRKRASETMDAVLESAEALSEVPLSSELLNYYRERLAASEDELQQCRARVEACETSQAAQHKARWELHKRMEEITDLQKALSDSHVYLWEERERCQRLQAENDELKIQEVEDRRKIQHLLSLVEPVMQDVTYIRDSAPETMTIHAHARATTTSAPASRSVRAGASAPAGGAPGGGGDRPRVLRTVYLPNEKVDSLLLTIESLRAQMQQSETLARERVAALLEDRRLRMEEERARRSVEAEKLQESELTVERLQALLHKYTKDYLALKHDALQTQRVEKETIEALRVDNRQIKEQMASERTSAEVEVHAVSTSAKQSSEQYVSLFRQQVCDTERTMGLLKDRHSGLQQALVMRVKELEEYASRTKQQYKALEERRRLEAEGFRSELTLMHKEVQRVELRVFGQRTPLGELGEEETLAAVGARGPLTDAKLNATKQHLAAVRARIATLERGTE